MSRPTPETGGGTPQNQGLSEFKVLPEQKGVGPRVQKPEEPKQQPANPNHDISKFYRREQDQHSGVLKNPIRVPQPLSQNPGEQRGEGEPFQSKPVEQQVAERLGKPPPEKAGSKTQEQGNQAIVRRSEALPAQPQISELRTPEVNTLASRMLFPYILLEGKNDAEYNHAVEVLIRHALETYPGLSAGEAMKRLYDDTQDNISFA